RRHQRGQGAGREPARGHQDRSIGGMTMHALATLALLAPEAGGAAERCSGLFDCTKYHFSAGGWGMWPILGLFIATVVIVLERLAYLSKASIDKQNLVSHL